jgi:hypothetical protein
MNDELDKDQTEGKPVDDHCGVDRREEGRRKTGERRDIIDRRIGLDRRRGPGVRRPEARRAAEEGEMTADQFEFLQAINEYKKVNKRPFPTWSEVLDVMRALGYRKVAEPSDIE